MRRSLGSDRRRLDDVSQSDTGLTYRLADLQAGSAVMQCKASMHVGLARETRHGSFNSTVGLKIARHRITSNGGPLGTMLFKCFSKIGDSWRQQ